MHNVNFLEKNAAGLHVELPALSNTVSHLFSNKPQLEKMGANAAHLGHPQAASSVVAELEILLGLKKHQPTPVTHWRK
jgi:UDP-N-acetylglucosamine:LPS N-acetylglucosamine transferase